VTQGDDLDALVRRVDPDRWLASRFIASPEMRAPAVCLYALNYELAHIAESVSQTMIGEIRLAWWREGLEALFEAGDVRPHPVLQGLAGPIRTGILSRAVLDELVEARHVDLEPEPFKDEAALIGYIDATAGGVMALAAQALDRRATPQMTRSAGRAWGWAGLMRAKAFWEARGRRWTPENWADASEAEVASHVRHRIADALREARTEMKSLPVAAFPAVAYATLAGPYARRPELSDMSKRTRITLAVARGRL